MLREPLMYQGCSDPLLRFGDRVRIEMPGPDGRSLFGAINQQIVQAK